MLLHLESDLEAPGILESGRGGGVPRNGTGRSGVSSSGRGGSVVVNGKEDLSDDIVVQSLSSSERRAHEPEDEEGLGNEVEGEPIQNRPDGGALNEVEEPEDDPVSQPLLVVGLSGALEGLDTQVSGKNPTNQVGQGAGQSEEVEEDQEDGGGSETEDTVDFGNTSLSLDVVKDGVLTEGLVQLDKVVVTDSSTLLNERMVKDLVGGLVGTSLGVSGLGVGRHCDGY